MTDTASTNSTSTPTAATWTRWLYPILAVTGIAVGISVIGAVYYLIFAQPGCCPAMMKADAPTTQSKDCCASMMKDKKMPMENMPSMSPMPGMPSMPSMPNMPMPGR